MRVLIFHFRSAPARGLLEQQTKVDPLDSAGTDGVSLEIAKRQVLLEAMGHKVAICSAYDWADFPVPALEFDREEVVRMRLNLFGPKLVDFAGEVEFESAFRASVPEMKSEMAKVVDSFEPNLLFVHNILSLPVHPVATVSLTELLRETQLPCSAIHHDILSEGAYKFAPTCNFARSILEGYYPPKMPNLRHWTINTRNKRSLKEKSVDAQVIHDTMDFDRRLEPGEHKRVRAHLRTKYGIEPHDVVLFVGARIVPNKQTELAGHLTAVLQSLRQEMVGRKLYHGEVFSSKSRVVLVLAGRPERAFVGYQDRLSELFDMLRIMWRYVGDDVRPHRYENEGLYALYPDMYAMADFVLYPTGWEGFGNQLLEAIAAGLPVVLFEYPVFREDIAPQGVIVVSMGDTILKNQDSQGLVQLPADVLSRAAHEMMEILTDPEKFQSITVHNVGVGRKHFSFNALRAHLGEAVSWARETKNRKSR